MINKYIEEYLIQNEQDLQKSGVYNLIGEKNEILYVGKAKNLFNRLSNYKTITYDKTEKISSLIKKVKKIKVHICKNEYDALLTEIDQINSLMPKYNTLLRDDKSFPYLKINKTAEFPSIQKFRGKMDFNNNIYFGPFVKSKIADEIIDEVRKIFKLRSCSDNAFKECKKSGKPCMDYHIKKCSGPCANKINSINYQEDLNNAIDFLSGNSDKYIQDLEKKMMLFAEKMDYSEAQKIKEKIDLIKNKNIKTYDSSYTLNNSGDFDVINFHIDSKYCFFYISFIRNFKNYNGYSSMLNLENTINFDNSEIINNFLTQFYLTNQIPNEIILPEKFENFKLVEKYFRSKYQKFKNFFFPDKKDTAYQLILQAKDNAIQSAKEFFNNRQLFEKNITEISKILSIDNLKMIHVFDNSHFSGSDAIGGVVCVDKNGFMYSEYRKIKFKKDENNQNDYEMMKRSVQSRLKYISEKQLNPEENLFIIDGGMGHLSVVSELLNSESINNLKIIAISKGDNRFNGINEIHCKFNNELTYKSFSNDANLFIQKIRDEAHRYAVTGHRKERSKKETNSSLDSIKGLKRKEKILLLSIFGSVYNIKNSTEERILDSIPTISKKMAKKILESL